MTTNDNTDPPTMSEAVETMSEAVETILGYARSRGYEAGQDALFSYRDAIAEGLEGAELRTDPLSGEWAGESIPELLGDLIEELEELYDPAWGIPGLDDATDASSLVCDAYEEGYFTATTGEAE